MEKIFKYTFYALVIIGGILSTYLLIPFIQISFYNTPASDDFCTVNDVIELGIIKGNLKTYLTWSGRFIVTFFQSTLNPLYFNDYTFYKVFPIIYFILIIFSNFWILRILIPTLHWVVTLCLSTLICAVFTIQIPFIQQSFYWYSGAITYIHGIIFINLYIASVLSYLNQKKILYYLLSIFFALLVAGSNETSSLIIISLTMAYVVYVSINTYKIKWSLILLCVISILFFLITYLAPGNAVRMSYFNHDKSFERIFDISYNTATQYLLLWFNNTPMFWLSLTLASLISFYKVQKADVKKIGFFGIFTVATFLLSISLFFVSFYATNVIAGRTLNLIFYNTFFLLTILLSLWFILVHRKPIVQYLVLSGFVLVTSVKVFEYRKNKNNGSYDLVTKDLKYGYARGHYDYTLSKFKSIKSQGDTAKVYPPTAYSYVLTNVEELKQDPNDWVNDCYKRYFNKKAVYLSY